MKDLSPEERAQLEAEIAKLNKQFEEQAGTGMGD
jgi:hypothetical protein